MGVCPISRIPLPIHEKIHRAAEDRFYTPGCTIASQGQPAKGIFVIKSGWVKTLFQTRADRQVAGGLHGPGNILALPDVIMAGRFSMSIETIEDCEIEYIPGEKIRSLMEEEPSLSLHLLLIVSGQFLKAMDDIYESSGVSTSERLLQVLRDLAVQCGRETGEGVRMRLPFTVQHLADRVGCSRQWATKALAELEEKGLVRRTRGWITISRSAARQGTKGVPTIVRVTPREV